MRWWSTGTNFAAHGYETTILDFSKEQLDKDRLVAERENLDLQTVQADMTQAFLLKTRVLISSFVLFQMFMSKI